MNRTLLILLLLFVFIASAAASPPPPPPPAKSCSDEIVTFSTCLSYIAMPPNNITDSPSSQCCDDVSIAFTTGAAVCFCYFIRRPNILGFPLNSTKLVSLTSLCPVKEENPNSTFSLQTLCSGSTALPPLHSITGGNSPPRPNVSRPPPPNASGPPPPPPPPPIIGSSQDPSDTSLTPEPTEEELPTQPSSSIAPAMYSTTSERIDKFSWTLLIFPCLHYHFFVNRYL